MAWLANMEDGTSVNSKQMYWDQLPTDKRVVALQLTHPQWDCKPKPHLCLTEKDAYFFLREATASFGQQPSVIAEIIGGIDRELKVVTEIRLEVTGSISIVTYPLESLKYNGNNVVHEGERTSRRPGRQKPVSTEG